VVDREVVARKVAAVIHHTARLRRRLPLSAAALDADEDLCSVVYFDLLQAIQGCIDLAVHACTHDSLGVPENPASAFALLAQHGVVEAGLSVRLASAAGLRNLIVHRYGDVVTDLVVEALKSGLDDLEAFAAALRARR
jgi:uncharacterized protein YutE (UPF0331/DUF86 family)